MKTPEQSIGTAQGASSEACLFGVGRLIATSAAVDALCANGMDPYALLRRHERGDHGAVTEIEREANGVAVAAEKRVLSCYQVGKDEVYIVTEIDQHITTILLASEVVREPS